MLQTACAALPIGFAGVLFWLYGYRLFLASLPLWGFIAGFWLGASLVSSLPGEGFLTSLVGIGAGFIGGLFFAALSYAFYLVGIGLVVFIFGIALGSGIVLGLGLEPGPMTVIIALVSGIALTGVAFIFDVQRYVIMLITCIGGANLMTLAFLLAAEQITLESVRQAGNAVIPVLHAAPTWLIAWLFLTIVGFTIQMRTSHAFSLLPQKVLGAWRNS